MATVKFSDEMPKPTSIKGTDRFLISDGVTGEAKAPDFNQAKEYLNITGIEMEPLLGGTTSGTALVVPNGPAGEQRTAEVSSGKWYDFGSGPVEASADRRWKSYWNGTSWVLKDLGELPATPTVNNVTSTSVSSALAANQGRILNEKIEGGKSVIISGYTSGYINTSGAINPSSSYRNSVFIAIQEGKRYVALVSGTSSVMVVSAYSGALQTNFISGSPVNKLGEKPIGTTPYEIVFEIPIGAGITHVKLCSHTSILLTDLYLIELDDNGIKNRIIKAETDLQSLDSTVFGEAANLPISSWNTGYINGSGAITASGSYFHSDPIAVTPGKYEARVSGTSSVMAISSYSGENQSDFVNGAPSNIMGTAPSGNVPTIFTVTVQPGVTHLKLVRHSSLPEGDVYLKKLDESSLLLRVSSLEENGLDIDGASIVKSSINYFNNRDKAIFCWIWDDLNDSDELVFNVFKEYGFAPNFALPSNKLNSENVKLYKRVIEYGGSILSHDTGSTINNSSIINSKKAIEAYGFKVSGYVAPGSVLDVALLPTAKKVYGYAFTKNPPNKGVYPTSGFDSTVDVGELARVGIETWNMDESNQQALKNLIDWAILNKKKVPLYGHQLPSTYLNTDGVTSRFSESDLRGLLLYIRNKVDNGDCLFVSADEFMFQTYR